MKSSNFPTAHKLLLFASATLVVFLMSFSPTRLDDNDSTLLSDAELLELVDDALKDSSFQIITELDVKRFLGMLKSNMPINTQKSKEFAQKKSFSTGETNYIFSLFGFSGEEDFKSYANLLASFGRKYGIDKIDLSSQKRFFEILRKRQTEYITNNNLLEKVFQKYATPGPGGMPPECWKCVYDFRDCTTGTVSNWVISYTTMTTTWTTYDMRNGGISITRWEYDSPSRPTITYINSTFSTASCEGVYRNCMNSCATP